MVYSIRVEIGPARASSNPDCAPALIDSFGLNSTNLNGPVPIGWVRISRRRHMAGIDRRTARGEQRDERRLRPLQVERDLVIAVGGHSFEVAVPGLARIDLRSLSLALPVSISQVHFTSAGERLAVVPFDALAQLEGQVASVLAPRTSSWRGPARSVEPVLRAAGSNMTRLLNTAHERHGVAIVASSRIDALGGIVAVRDAQHAARLLRQRRASRANGGQQTGRHQPHPQSRHVRFPGGRLNGI